jgi:hypothetical protein
LDKIKLYSKQKDAISKQIIDNEFEFQGSSYDDHKHNTRIKYANNKVSLTIDNYGLQIITNPTSYLMENNICQINRKELESFKEIFESDLHTDTNKYTLTGFDYNTNITTDYPVGSYLKSFDLLPKYKKEIYPNGTGITYVNKCKSFSIYDKVKQIEKINGTMPEDFLNTNIMRLELGIESRLNKTSNLSNIHTLQNLISIDNYISMINEYKNIYSKIHKQPLHKFLNMTKPHPSIMKTDDFILIYYINETGLDGFINSLDQERRMEVISYKQMKSRKDKAIYLWNEYSKLDDNTFDLFKEMNDKVYEQINTNIEIALN